MQEVLKTYLELQQIDGERLEIEGQLAKYPAMREDLAVTLKMAKDAVAELEADDQQGELDRRKYEKELAGIEQKEKRLHQQEQMVQNEKQAEALSHEEARLEEQASDLETNILEIMTAADDRVSALAEAREDLIVADAETAKESARIDSLETAKREALVLLNEDRERFCAELDRRAMMDYDNVAASNPGNVVATLMGDACGGCHTELLPSQVVALGKGEEVVRCPHCDRFLTQAME